jgi:hypothetical protein
MNTAVQLRSDAHGPRCKLLCGSPVTTVVGSRGPVALFAPGTLVAYALRTHRSARLFVFRTLSTRDRLAASLPGVSPEVWLLLNVKSVARVRLARRLFAYLLEQRIDPALLADAFYIRLGAALEGRIPKHTHLESLLPASFTECPWTS